MLFKQKKILIVDDEEDIVSFLAALVRQWGNYHVSECSSLGEVFSEMKVKKFDLIISDINIQESSGYELVKLLNENSLNTPVILISGQVNIYDDSSCPPEIYKQIHGYISKPFKPDELKVLVTEAFKQKDRKAS